jgi:hypothetical protein
VLEWLDYPLATTGSFLISAGADGTVKLWCKVRVRVSFSWQILNCEFKDTSSFRSRFSSVGMYTVYDTAIENLAWRQNWLAVVGTGRLTVFAINVKSSGKCELIIQHQMLAHGLSRPVQAISGDTATFTNSSAWIGKNRAFL